MDEEKSAWAMLGKSAGLTGKTEDVEALENRIKELESTISVIQGELLGSIEALQRRIANLEHGEGATSVLEVMPVEEVNELLGTSIGEWPEQTEEDREEITVVQKGFSYSKPDEVKDTEVEEPIEEVGDDEYNPATDGPDSVNHRDCALAIVDFISDNGGIANADWKRRSLTPAHYDAKDRKKIDTILREELGVVKWNKNNMWHFYYMDGDDKDEALERAYGTRTE